MTTEPILGPTATKILVTAKGLFMQRGYRAVSVNDIVQAAAITKPTLYYHFADKEEVFAQMSLHMLTELHEHMSTAIQACSTTSGRLTAIAHVMTTATDGDTRMMRREMREHLSPAQRARIGAAFQQQIVEPVSALMMAGIAHGDLAPHPPDHLAWMFLSMIEGFHHGAEDVGSAVTVAQISPEALIDLFLHGVSPRDMR